MGEYANLHANEMYNEYLDYNYDNQLPKDSIPLNSIPYYDIKKRTEKAVLIKLALQVAPFNMELYDVDYMWLPIKHIRLNEEYKQVAIVQWLYERKVDEQCSAIAERIIKL